MRTAKFTIKMAYEAHSRKGHGATLLELDTTLIGYEFDVGLPVPLSTIQAATTTTS